MTPKQFRQKSVNFSIQWMREHYPSKFIYPGTGLRDIVINAFAGMTWAFWQTIDNLKKAMNISNYNIVSSTSLDLAANIWFLTRNDAKRSSTVWRIFFSEPISLRIPIGFQVGGNGLKYMAMSVFTFSKSSMGNNRSGSLYYVDFPVTATLPGSKYNVAANTLHDIYTPLSAPAVSSTNVIASTGGTSKETNKQYYDRLNAGVNTRQNLITASSIMTVLQSEFPSFDAINIQGKGDEFMQRDKKYGVAGPGGQAPYTKSDFYFKGNSFARRASSEDALLALQDLKSDKYTIELTYEEYKQIAKHDLKFFVESGGLIYSEVFYASPADYKIGDWTVSDSGFRHGEKKYGNSSVINTRGLVLGVPSKTTIAIEGI